MPSSSLNFELLYLFFSRWAILLVFGLIVLWSEVSLWRPALFWKDTLAFIFAYSIDLARGLFRFSPYWLSLLIWIGGLFIAIAFLVLFLEAILNLDPLMICTYSALQEGQLFSFPLHLAFLSKNQSLTENYKLAYFSIRIWSKFPISIPSLVYLYKSSFSMI